MARLTLTDITAGYSLIGTINANNALIEAFAELSVQRDGEASNAWTAEMDASSQRLINLLDAVNNQEPATLSQLNAAKIAASTIVAASVTIADANSDWVSGTLEGVLDGIQGGTEGIEP